MSTKSLSRKNQFAPSAFNDFLNPWNEWFDNGFDKMQSVPAVNISENKDAYNITIAAPGLNKNDFNIDVNGDLLTISSEKEEKVDETKEDFTRKEYSYSSFSRTFTLPEGVNRDKIDASYTDGILKLMLPKKEEAKKVPAKTIAVK